MVLGEGSDRLETNMIVRKQSSEFCFNWDRWSVQGGEKCDEMKRRGDFKYRETFIGVLYVLFNNCSTVKLNKELHIDWS